MEIPNGCEDCGALLSDRQTDTCEQCCPHEYDADEGFTCLNCGKDGAEHVMAAAYDRAKDYWKYGE